MLPKSASRRTSQRIKSGPFSLNQPTKKTAQVHLNRISSQFKKKLKHGTTMDIVDSVKSEIGILGLCILFFCLISVCYIVIAIIYGASDESSQNLHTMHNRAHPDHMADSHDINAHLNADNAMGHGLNIDPEHWPHHLSKESIEDEIDENNKPQIKNIRDGMKKRKENIRNAANFDPMKDRFDPRKMEEYLEKKNRRNTPPRPPHLEGLPQDIDLNNMNPQQRDEIIKEFMSKNTKDLRDDPYGRRKRRRSRERDRERRRPKERERDRRTRNKKRRRRRRRGDDEYDDYEYDDDDDVYVDDEDEDDYIDNDDVVNDDDKLRKEIEEELIENEDFLNDKDNENLSNWDKIWNSIKLIDLSESLENEVIDSSILEEKAYRIKSSFLHAWHGYAKHALGHDEIHPVSDLPGDSWGGLGATLIDALDTMMLMGIKDEFNEARNKLQEVNFDIDLKVSFFETTIRHLGGLIGAYEVSSILESRDDFLLKQAISLSDHLLPAFSTPLGMPKSMVNLQTGEIKNYGWTKDRSVLSEVGSNQLEFYAMSEYTKNNKYYLKSNNVFKLLNEAQNDNVEEGGEIGLFSRLIDTDSATFPKNEKVYSLGGMSDSFYEYTLKVWILSGYTDKLAIKMYVESINAANEKLLKMIYDKKRRKEPYYFYGEQWYNKFRGKMEELQCFMPGVLALGSYHALLRQQHSEKFNIPLTSEELDLINQREKHLKLSHVLIESCVSLYAEMPTGLAPESIEFNDNEWTAKEMKYQLRPETLESLFILYSLTGKEIYRKWAWNIYLSIEKHCKTDIAFSGIKDVTEIPAKQDNQMQSYVMAETFKYLYLLYDEFAASLLPLSHYVFNTEAHPIRIFDLSKEEWYNDENDKNDENT